MKRLPDARMNYLLKTESLRNALVYHIEQADKARRELEAIHEAVVKKSLTTEPLRNPEQLRQYEA